MSDDVELNGELREHEANLRLQIEAEERLFARTRRAELFKRVLIVVTLVVVCVLLGLTLWVVSLIRSTQETNSPVLVQASKAATEAKKAATQAAQTNQVIEDCVTRQGKCYQRNVKRTASALASINAVIRYTVACDRTVQGTGADHTQKELRDCVAGLVAEHIRKSPG